MTAWITSIMSQMGYLGIGLLMFLENIYPPIPSEVIMPLAGFSVAKGDLNLSLVILSGTLGAMLGTLIWYAVGYFLGKERLLLLVDRYGIWFTISKSDIEKADTFFQKYHAPALFFGRLIPGVRTVISLPAGISRVSFLPFLFYTLLGTTIWTTFLTLVGFYLASWEAVTHYIGYVVPAIIICLILWYLIRLYRQLKREH